MRVLPAGQQAIWEEGDYTGDNRPMARVTIQRLNVSLQRYNPERLYASCIFNQPDIPRELPNIKSVSWDRSIGQDVATCTVQLYNTAPLPLGETPEIAGDFDQPGYYTFNRGTQAWSSARWGYQPNSWTNEITPDRILRTYEGYGFDADVIPELDPHLTLTGVWLIDDVEFTHNGLIALTCRDLGRLLIEHIMFPPVVPLAAYPLSFEAYHPVNNPDIVTTTGGSDFRPTLSGTSNQPYTSSLDAELYGHKPSHAFDGNETSYWLSVGNALPSSYYSFEWVQGACGNRTVTAVKCKVWGGPYKIYLSVKKGGVWQGTGKIPYDPSRPPSAPNGSDIHYVKAMTVSRDGWAVFDLGAGYTNVQDVRVTFTNLFNSGLGSYPYRAGVREVVCSQSHTVTTDGGTHQEGDYGDYTEVVKLLLAYGGFHWPRNATTSYIRRSDGVKVYNMPSADDPYLKTGRVWGDLLMSKVSGPAKLTENLFDKKPLMDGINYVKEILGYIFFVDETGGAVFRLPNIFQVGNVVMGVGTTTDVLEIDEKQTLIGLRAKLSSRNMRENVFIANVNGKIGATAAGYIPPYMASGLRRVGGWTDQNFQKTSECQVMADLIVVRQMFEFRTNSVTISANPAIQIDDQVKIFERVTNEGHYHYVKAIHSENDLESGKWTYELGTHWLGEEPYAKWAFDPAALSAATKTYLSALGKY